MYPQDYLSEEAKFAVAAYILNLKEWIKPTLKIIISQNQNGMKFVHLHFLQKRKFFENMGSTGFDSKFPWRSKQVERWDTARK